MSKKHEEKWVGFVRLAVARFMIWLDCIENDDSCRQNVEQDFESGLSPIDVVMVLHTFMLNPKKLRTYCNDTSSKSLALLSLQFPWKEIVSGALKNPVVVTG